MLILRGDLRRAIPIAGMERVHVEGEALCFTIGSEQIVLALGADVAARWAKKIAAPPRSLADKLGVSGEAKALVLGDDIHDPALEAALEGARAQTEADAALSVAIVTDEAALGQALQRHARLPNGAPIWIVHRKGRNASFGETSIRAAMRLRGFIDTKVASVSSRLTAIRYSRR